MVDRRRIRIPRALVGTPWFGALIGCAAGAALGGIALLDPRDDAFSSGRGPVLAAGAAFFFAGLAIATAAVKDCRLRTGLQGLFGTFVLGAMGSLAGRIALGDDPPPVAVRILSLAPCAILAGFALVSTVRHVRDLIGEGSRRPATLLAAVALASIAGSGLAGWAAMRRPVEDATPLFDASGEWTGGPFGTMRLERREGIRSAGRYDGGEIEIWVGPRKDAHGDGWGRWRADSGQFGTLRLWWTPDQGGVQCSWSHDPQSPPTPGWPGYGTFLMTRPAGRP